MAGILTECEQIGIKNCKTYLRFYLIIYNVSDFILNFFFKLLKKVFIDII